jgi:hypothetical protein
MHKGLLLLGGLALSAVAALGGEVYKWTDAQGRVHYSASPPDGAPAQVVRIHPSTAPAPPQVREPRPASGPAAAVAADAPPDLPSGRPSPLPENQVSEYLRTLATLVGSNVNRSPPLYSFSIMVRVRADVPVGAVLVATFEDPAAAGRLLQARAKLVMTSDEPQKIKDEIQLQSPTFTEVRCRNYAVVIRLYPDERSSTPMGTHRQLIQSRVDSRLLSANPAWITRLAGGGHVCP